MSQLNYIRSLIREEIERRLSEETALKPSEQAKQLGLAYKGFGRWADSETGQIVAKTVNGQLVRVDPSTEPQDEPDQEPEPESEDEPISFGRDLDKDFDQAGRWRYKGTGSKVINPGWNKGMTLSGDDVAFDANADETVQKLLAKVGDPKKLMKWLVKKFKEETPNGKKRIAQYIGILKQMGADTTEEPEDLPQVDAGPSLGLFGRG